MAEVFGIAHGMHPQELPGTTLKTAAALGIPCIMAEAGQCSQLDEASTRLLMQGCMHVAQQLGILSGQPSPAGPMTVFRAYPWVRAEHTGCWYPMVHAGEMVRQGQRIGVIKDYFWNLLAAYPAPADGMVLLIATPLAINAGDPLFGLGIA